MHLKKLQALMVLHDDTVTSLARRLGISRQALSAKLNGRRDFLVWEVRAIAEQYRLTNAQIDNIFFGRSQVAAGTVGE